MNGINRQPVVGPFLGRRLRFTPLGFGPTALIDLSTYPPAKSGVLKSPRNETNMTPILLSLALTQTTSSTALIGILDGDTNIDETKAVYIDGADAQSHKLPKNLAIFTKAVDTGLMTLIETTAPISDDVARAMAKEIDFDAVRSEDGHAVKRFASCKHELRFGKLVGRDGTVLDIHSSMPEMDLRNLQILKRVDGTHRLAAQDLEGYAYKGVILEGQLYWNRSERFETTPRDFTTLPSKDGKDDIVVAAYTDGLSVNGVRMDEFKDMNVDEIKAGGRDFDQVYVQADKAIYLITDIRSDKPVVTKVGDMPKGSYEFLPGMNGVLAASWDAKKREFQSQIIN